jgi:hypothetical protein
LRSDVKYKDHEVIVVLQVAGQDLNLQPSGYEWLSVTADFPSTGYVFSVSLTIFDSKEPVEFGLPQSTTVLALYNTNVISKQINEPELWASL